MNMIFVKRLDILSQMPFEDVLNIMDVLTNSASNDNQPASPVQDTAN